MQTQFWGGTATSDNQMRQDKLRKLREAKMGWNPLPMLALGHIDHQSDPILAHIHPIAANLGWLRVPDNFTPKNNPQSVDCLLQRTIGTGNRRYRDLKQRLLGFCFQHFH